MRKAHKYIISFNIKEITHWWKPRDKGCVRQKLFTSDKDDFVLKTEITRKIDEVLQIEEK